MSLNLCSPDSDKLNEGVPSKRVLVRSRELPPALCTHGGSLSEEYHTMTEKPDVVDRLAGMLHWPWRPELQDERDAICRESLDEIRRLRTENATLAQVVENELDK